ncbi:MAG: nucleotide exchange factor GrpE [Cucumibacter sp.]
MTDDNETSAGAANATEAAAQDAAPAAPADPDPLMALAAENAELKEQLLRAIAETDNSRKRLARELQETRQYAVAGFARDMLTATDNLTRALNALPQEERRAAEGTLKALIDGVELTEREMQRLLLRHGIERIEAKGERFDPHRHQAMFEVEDAEAADNTVVEVIQDGFQIGERVLRPAFVGVARRPRKAEGDALQQSPADEPEPGAESAIDKTV